MISSPVEMIATRGRRTTATSPRPIAASTPVSREVSRVPFAEHQLAPRDVGPGEGDVPPGATGRWTTQPAVARGDARARP